MQARVSFSSQMDTVDKCVGKEEEFVTKAKNWISSKNVRKTLEMSVIVNSENKLTNYKRQGDKDMFSVPGGGWPCHVQSFIQLSLEKLFTLPPSPEIVIIWHFFHKTGANIKTLPFSFHMPLWRLISTFLEPLKIETPFPSVPLISSITKPVYSASQTKKLHLQKTDFAKRPPLWQKQQWKHQFSHLGFKLILYSC